jgi:predicted N-formylglutamate amidohydrolase
MPFRPEQVVVTCEHASNRIPRAYRGLGLGSRALEAHIAWDRGALPMARLLARRLGAPLHAGRWSRLLIDLNRSPGHPKLVARSSFGVLVPGNRDVDGAEIERRLRRWHAPYREAVLRDVRRAIAAHDACLHLSVHTFAPVVDGIVRDLDIGLLYDPARRRESDFVARLVPRLASRGLRVRRNAPYRGTSDGFTAACRRLFPAARYAGIEIETNQKQLRDAADARRLGRILAQAVAEVLAAG